MKIFLLSTITIILISGCATKNAFTKLNIDEEQEKSIENTKSTKLMHGTEVGGVFSAIYLNNIYKDIDSNKELFYVSIFRKDTSSPLRTNLNAQEAMQMKKLSSFNKYPGLLGTNNKWTQNYLVSFESTKSVDLNLSIDSGQFSSGPLEYSRDLL